MANSVRVVASVDDKISGPMGGIRNSLEKTFGDEMTKRFAAGAIAARAVEKGFDLVGRAISAVTDYVGDSIQAFREDEKSQAGLKAALLANIPAWNGNTDAIEKTMAARMRLGFSDDEQREALKILIAVTHDSTKALTAQRVAMDLARFRGIDLASASDLIGKVMGGNVGILRRYGISIKDGATATEALAEVTRLAGGAARAYAETDIGKATDANIRLEESQERVGAAFSRMGTKVMPIVADVAEGVSDFVARGIEGWEMLGNLIGKKVDEITGKVPEIPEALEDLDLKAITETAAEPIYTYFDAAAFKAEMSVKEGMRDIAGEIRKGRGDIVSAMKQVISDTYDPLVLAADIAVTRLELADAEKLANTKKYSELTKAEIRNMTDEQIRAAQEWTDLDRAEAQKRILTLKQTLAEQLAEQTQYGTDSAVLAAQSGAYTTAQWRAGLTSADAGVAADWAHLLEIQIAAQLKAEATAKSGGIRVANAWIDGLAAGILAGSREVSGAISKSIGSQMIGFSPPKEGPLKDIDKGGERIAHSWVAGMSKGIDGGGIDNALSRITDRLAAGPSAASGGLSTAAGAVGGGMVIQSHIYLDGRELQSAVARQEHYRTGQRGLLPA